MKRIFLIIAIVFSQTIDAQNVSFTFGEEFKGDAIEVPQGFVKSVTGDLYFHRAGTNTQRLKNFLHKINRTNLNTTNELEIGVPEKDTYSAILRNHNERLLWFLMRKNKKEKITENKIFEIFPKIGMQHVQTLKPKEYKEYSDIPLEKIFFSQDSSYVVIADFFDYSKKKKSHSVNFSLLDKNLKEVLNKRVETKTKKKGFSTNLTITVDNDGNIAWVDRDEQDKKNKKLIINLLSKDGTIKSTNIARKNYDLLGHAGVKFNNKGDLFFIVPFKQGKKAVFPDGIIIYHFDKNLEVINKTKRDFTDSEKEKYGQYKSRERGNINYYEMNHSWVDENNEINVFIEKKFIGEARFPIFDPGDSGIYKQTNDAMYMKVNDTGEVRDLTFIPKIAVSLNELITGTICISSEHGPIFLYNDSKKNLKKPLSDYMKYSPSVRTLPVVAFRNTEGEFERKVIEVGKGYSIVSNAIYKLNENEYLICFIKNAMFRTKYRIAKIKIK